MILKTYSPGNSFDGGLRFNFCAVKHSSVAEPTNASTFLRSSNVYVHQMLSGSGY
jgi:hypothetical protein